MAEIIFYLFAPVFVGAGLFAAIYYAGLVVIDFWQWFSGGAFQDES